MKILRDKKYSDLIDRLKQAESDIKRNARAIFDLQNPNYKYGDKIKFRRICYLNNPDFNISVPPIEGVVKTCRTIEVKRVFSEFFMKEIEVDTGKGIILINSDEYTIEKL